MVYNMFNYRHTQKQNSGKRLFSLQTQGNILTVIITSTLIIARCTNVIVVPGMGQDTVKRLFQHFHVNQVYFQLWYGESLHHYYYQRIIRTNESILPFMKFPTQEEAIAHQPVSYLTLY